MDLMVKSEYQNMDIEDIDLCAFCSDLALVPLDETDHLPSQRPHHPTYSRLSSSSNTCALCRFLIPAWDDFKSSLQSHGGLDGLTVETTAARRMQSGLSWKCVDANLVTGPTGVVYMSRFTIVTCPSGTPASNTDFWASPSTSFDRKITRIQSWMQDCRSHDGHGNCQPIPFTPLRLVTVGLDNKPVRLIERGSVAVDTETEYAALSYCWGPSLPLRTTKQSLDLFRESIPLDLMPKTFTEAINIARSLRIPYIWIDALCIVQDDEVEWQSEAAQMRQIYQGSQLTITATQSTSSSDGSFRPNKRDNPSYGEFVFRTRPADLDGRGSLVRVYRDDIRGRATRGNAINTRGWTLQEQLLSPRVVFCMDSDMHWQCQECYQTQSGLSFEPGKTLDGDMGFLFLPNRGHRLDREEHHKLWRRIAHNFSEREFTYYQQDRVPAIAGISQAFASTLHDVPILGLWSKSFATDLAWCRAGPIARPYTTSGAAQCLPTWTWLSCPGGIMHMADFASGNRTAQTVENLRLLDWDLQWHGTPYVSRVKMAEARVEGPVREIQLASVAQASAFEPVYLQVFGEDTAYTSGTKIPWRCVGQFDDPNTSIAGTYSCLLLISSPRGASGTRQDSSIETFLIIEPVEPQQSFPRYRRIGSARILGELPTFDCAETRSLILV